MPVDVTDKYIRIRQRDPSLFVENSFRTIVLSEDQGISAVIGKLTSDPGGSTVIQSYLFLKDKWTVAEAEKWVKDHKKSSSQIMQCRYVDSVTRMNFEDQKNPKIEGYAAVFNQRANLWGDFWEQVAPGAFTESLRSNDVYALWNHNPDNVLGNTGARTLELSEDRIGLKYSIIPPDTTLGRDVTTLIKRGDVRKSSFRFNIKDERMEKLPEGKGVIRTILKASPLFDVSPVTYPAYPQTEVHVRMIAGEKESIYLFEDSDELIVVPEAEAPATSDQLNEEWEALKAIAAPRKR